MVLLIFKSKVINQSRLYFVFAICKQKKWNSENIKQARDLTIYTTYIKPSPNTRDCLAEQSPSDLWLFAWLDFCHANFQHLHALR